MFNSLIKASREMRVLARTAKRRANNPISDNTAEAKKRRALMTKLFTTDLEIPCKPTPAPKVKTFIPTAGNRVVHNY